MQCAHIRCISRAGIHTLPHLAGRAEYTCMCVYSMTGLELAILVDRQVNPLTTSNQPPLQFASSSKVPVAPVELGTRSQGGVRDSMS